MILQSTVVDEEELRELIDHQERIREDERKRIAREIHDELGQRLLALRIEVTLLKQETFDSRGRRKISPAETESSVFLKRTMKIWKWTTNVRRFCSGCFRKR